MHLKLESGSMHQTMSEADQQNGGEMGGEATAMPDRVKDDMANRRTSTHIPAPLRKKRTEDQYKKFITPSGNPVVYLQQHMRSKSMSDLADEKRDEESHRAEINTRYEEMDKLKVMLKEEEDTWTSHLQSWKSRRKSVTEDARKRKEERDSLEKGAELKTGRRRTKTYQEIVDDKMKRDQELANLQDPDDVTSPVTSPRMSNDPFDPPIPVVVETSSRFGKASTLPHRYSSSRHNDTSHRETGSNASVSSTGSPVQYKYTTKLTTTISHVPTYSGSSSSELSRSEVKHQVAKQIPAAYEQPAPENKITSTSTLYTPYTPPSVPRAQSQKNNNNQSIGARKKALEDATKAKTPPTWSQKNASTSPAVKRETRSANVPNVLLRTKNPNARKERPKSAHESRSGANPNWTSSLPRNYHEYSAPKPFTQGGSNFAQYRKTAFASRRSMWENISKDNEDVPPEASEVPAKPRQKMNLTRDALVSGNNHAESVTPSYLRQQATNKSHAPGGRGGNRPPPKVPLVTLSASAQLAKDSDKSKTHYPAKVPLVAANSNLVSAPPPHSEKMPVSTATLYPAGLSMTSPPANKAATLPRMGGSVENNILFDDMKICINQRPRSEKGFGFTVRGGDDGKPVIVDTVSPGGAADICQLCVGDEILAINDVMLADCKTQDDIVQLIVSSVITGSLSLNIRRYGKVKKSSPLRLSGTKVVMTPGGFVQVRSDKAGPTQTRTPHISKFQKDFSTPTASVTDANNNKEFLNDLPPPPSQEELDGAFVPTKSGRSQSPLSGLISAASKYDDEDNEGSDGSSTDSFAGDALSEVHTNRVDDEGEEELRREVLEAQKALDFEEVYEHYDQERRKEEHQLRLRLQEEQQKLEEEEAQREAVRRRILEESRLEDLRVEEELRRIQARTQQQQQQRRMEYEKQGVNPGKKAPVKVRQVPEANSIRAAGGKHWMVDEAERLRMAEKEGKPRANALQYGRPEQQGGRGLPPHVIQRLTERTSVHRGNNTYGHEIAATSWNHPNAKATLL